MASNITLTPSPANSPMGIVTTVLYGTKDAGLVHGASGSYVYTHFGISSPGSMQIVPYAGYKNVDAKYMAGNTNRFLINGYVFDGNGNDSDIYVAVYAKNLLEINKGSATWEIKLGSTVLTSTKGAVILNIVGHGMGDGTGPRFPFTIELQDLGK